MYSLPLEKQSNHSDKIPSQAGAASSLSSRSLKCTDINKSQITVRFELNEFDTVAQVYPESTTIEEVLENVSSKFQLLPKYLSIKQKFGAKLPKTARLYELCSTNDFGILDVILELSDLAIHINESIRNEHEKIRLDTNLYYRQNLLPDFISVTTFSDKDVDPLNLKQIIVEIINIPIIKPFLGGYVNKKTGVVYHNAYTQTGPFKEQIYCRYNGLVSRDTQTTINDIPMLTRADDELREKADFKSDKLTIEMIIKNRMAVVIQRAFRLYLWKCFIHNLSIERRSRECDSENAGITELQREQYSKVKISSRNKVVDSGSNCHAIIIGSPRTRKDFESLEFKVQKWKENKIDYIKEHFTDKAKKQLEFTKLLEEEIRLLNEIDKKRNKIRKYVYEQRMNAMLDKMGAPIKWIGYKNIQCEMDLLQCQKIRKLTTLYRTQLKTSGTKIDRIEFLSELYTILLQEPHSTLLNELLDMLKREQKMLLAGIDKETIESLHHRQNELFRNFIASQKVYKPQNLSQPQSTGTKE